MAAPVGLEDDLLDAAIVGPFGGDQLGAARGAAVQQDHAGMLGLDLVEGGPDAVMVLIVAAAGDEDARALGHEDLGLRAALGVDEVAAVADGGGTRAWIALGAGQPPPRRAGAPP